jgi:hypothetical protein
MRATQDSVYGTVDQFGLYDIPVPSFCKPRGLTQSCDEYEIYRRREIQLVRAIVQASGVIQEIVNSSEQLFDVRHTACGPSYLRPRRDSLGGKLVQILRDLEIWNWEIALPLHQFNPHFKLLLQARRLMPDIAECLQQIDTAQMKAAEAVADRLNDLADHMRQLASTPAWRAQAYELCRKHADNYQSLCDYINALYEHVCARNLIIRLDLAYRLHHASLMPRMSEISISQARTDLAKFLRYVRENFPLTGYARRLEYGYFTGYHFHVLLLLDGHRVQGDVATAYLLGEHWQKVITEGQGRYYNCNAEKYPERGVGMIDYFEPDKRRVLLERVAPYLTKIDFWMEFMEGGKAFARGQMPKKKSSNAGRPRLHNACIF